MTLSSNLRLRLLGLGATVLFLTVAVVPAAASTAPVKSPPAAAASTPSAAESQQAPFGVGSFRELRPGEKLPDPPPRKEWSLPRTADQAAPERYISSLTSPPIPGWSVWSGWVYCPTGMQAFGGGENNNNYDGFVLNHTYALAGGSGWQVVVSNRAPQEGTFTVYAVCVRGASNYQLVNNGVPADPGDLGGGSAYVSCPAGTIMMGGGAWSDTDNAYVSGMNHVWGGWQVHMVNYDSVRRTVYAQGICASGIYTSHHERRSTIVIEPGRWGIFAIECREGYVMLGGGGSGEGARIAASYPSQYGQFWTTVVYNNISRTVQQPRITAQCAG